MRIKVYIPKDSEFNYRQCEKLFKKNEQFMDENQEFRDIVKNTFFYSFYDDKNFIGCIYYFEKDDKLFMSGFSVRGNHLNNVKCIKMTFEWFNCDIYAQTQHKTAIFCLYRCGFKKVGKNLYKYERG